MRVLLTGASGFIGKNIANRLSARHDVKLYGVGHTKWPSPKGIKADLRNSDDVKNLVSGRDVVIHAAAVTTGAKDVIERPYVHTTDNAIMSSLLLRAAYEAGVKHFIFFGSTTVYRSSEAPVKESDWDGNAAPEPNYFASAWTKIYVEKMCEFYASLGRTNHTVLRNANVYGPHDKFDLERSHVFGATVTKVMTAPEGGQITVWGDGSAKRDLLYVDDLVDAVEAAMEKQTSNYACYNIGSGSMISVDGLVGKIVDASGRKLSIVHDTSKPSINTALCLDCTKAHQELGWYPKTSLNEGIQKTIEWWKANVASSAVG